MIHTCIATGVHTIHFSLRVFVSLCYHHLLACPSLDDELLGTETMFCFVLFYFCHLCPSTLQCDTIKEWMDGWNKWFHLPRPYITTIVQNHQLIRGPKLGKWILRCLSACRAPLLIMLRKCVCGAPL